MCDKFFGSVGISENSLFSGVGSMTVVHQIGEKIEGGFINHFMLSQFFRTFSKEEDNARAVLVISHHSSNHWVSIANKLGTNITVLQDNGKVTVIDLMKEAYNRLKARDDEYDQVKGVLSRVEEAVQGYIKDGSRRIFIILEDLTDFLKFNDPEDTKYFENSEKRAIELFLRIRALSLKYYDESNCALAVSCLVRSPELHKDSVEITRFSKTVSQVVPSIMFEVAPLSTGFSAHVNGFLKVLFKPTGVPNDKFVEQAFIKKFHFKLDSNNVSVTPL